MNDPVWQGIEQGWREGRLAHAWLVQGRPDGIALRFAERMLGLVFNHHPQVVTRSHPDIVWIEPRSKSRQIRIDEVRDLIGQLAQSAYSGGWKVGVILFADRMTAEASNALLKTLEEPPDRTLLLLLSDEPQSLLPTIFSRCQRISLVEDHLADAARWTPALLEIFSRLPPADRTEAGLLAAQLTGLLDGLKKEIEAEEADRLPEDLSAKEAKELLDSRATARLIEVRTAMIRLLLHWQRDVLLCTPGLPGEPLHFPEEEGTLRQQALLTTRSGALRPLASIEHAARQLDRNLPVEPVLNHLFRDMIR